MFEYPKTLNTADRAPLDLVLSRRSGSAKTMTGPGPDSAQLRQILAAGVRVPDHGKLAPWRFIVFEGDGRVRMGALLAEAMSQEKDSSPERAALEKERFLRAPMVIGVVSRIRDLIPIPVWEQQLSAGAVCQNILTAAHALGFVANWITEWPAYHPYVQDRLGLKPGERIAGFIYIGQTAVALQDRPRPDIDVLTTRF
jgi:nitroreductase